MLYEALRLALLTVFRNKLRSFLTVLGIVIGVASVIAMVTVGQGSTAQVQSDVASLGSNLLMIRPGAAARGPGGGANEAPSLTVQDATAVADQVASILRAAPASQRSQTIVFGETNRIVSVTGTDNTFLDIRGWTLGSGRLFNDSELRGGANVCILGTTTARALFGADTPVGSDVRIGKISCLVIGLLAERPASSFGQDDNDTVIMPLRTFQRRISGRQDVQTIYMTVRDGVSTDDATAEVTTLMRERRKLAGDDADNFNVFDMKQISSMLTGITGALTGLLSAVAGISLLVGGIGIMNIMLVSVTERTREIGIRMAVGATERQVLLQFLVEAIVLSLIGGVLGIGLGLLLGLAGSYVLNIGFLPDWRIILASFVFSAFVGVVFGFFPARRAARLNPIEALRHQ
jgi:putative ABC transport system permease protein